MTAAFHPQTNSQSEVSNKTIIRYLRCNLNGSRVDWPLWLPAIMFSYNTAVHSTTMQTPYFLTYHCHPRLPFFDSNLMQAPNGASSTTFDVQKLHTTFTLAKRFSEQAREKLVKLNEAKEISKSYEIGDLVLVSFPRTIHPVNSKIQHQFRGPYVVLAKVTPVTYQVALSLGGQTTTVHISRIKLYFPPLEHDKQQKPKRN